MTDEIGTVDHTYDGNGLIYGDSSTYGLLVYHYDHLGSTKMVTDENGSIEATFTYGTYGELKEASYNTTEYGIPAIRFLYNGQLGVTIDENGLYYMRSRYYNPVIKRFINQDILTGSIGNSASLNRYSYVEGNPVSYTDPFGLSPFKTILNIGHAVLDVLGCLPGIGGMLADLGNVILYSIEGNIEEAIKSFVFMLPGMDLLKTASKYAAKGGKLASAYAQALEMMHCLGTIGSAMLAANDLGNSIAGMIDKYLVNEEKVTIALGVEILFAAAHGVQTIHFAGLTLKLPDQLDYYKIDDIIAQAKKKADADTDAKKKADADSDAGKRNQAEVIDEDEIFEYRKPGYEDDDRDYYNDDRDNNDRYYDDDGGGCFVAGTLVKTEDGYKNIEDIKAGDRVYSRNMLTEEEGYREVEEVFVREAEEIVHLTIGSTCIDATTNHPFWVEDYGFKPAGDLETGDVVVTASGECVQVADAEIEYLDEPVAVYNFEVMDWGTYYVSGMEVLVHNKCSDEGGIDSEAWKAIDEYRSRIDGIEPLGDTIPTRGDNNGTVAFIEVNGNKVFGLNSSLLSDADKDLGRKYFAEMKQAGYFENVDVYGRGSGQVFTHAEAYSLMKAYSIYGNDIGKNVTIYCDRATCGICQNNLQYFKEYFGLEKLTVKNKNGNIFEY